MTNSNHELPLNVSLIITNIVNETRNIWTVIVSQANSLLNNIASEEALLNAIQVLLPAMSIATVESPVVFN